MRSLLPKAPPVCVAMSKNRASPKKIQLMTLSPPGYTVRYINVVQGRKAVPNMGHNHEFHMALST